MVLIDELTFRQYNFDELFDGLISRQINILTEILTDYSVRKKMLHICGQYF